MTEKQDSESIEIQLLLQAIYLKYGYDFRNYARASIRRRLLSRLKKSELQNFSEMQHAVLYDTDFFETLLLDLSVNVTEMFRDPGFYRAIRTHVVPILKTFPHLKIWHAGCASGEEVFSMAILLREEGLYEQAQLYATDIDETVLHKARAGVFPIDRVKTYTENYQRAGGKESFSDYYSAHYDHVIFDPELKQNILFADHNLATDGVFGEMHMVICRNVLIYFNKELQNRAFGLFADSLCDGGILCLGSRESIRFSKQDASFDDLVGSEKIYRKKTA